MCTLSEGKAFKTFEKLKQEFDLENGDLFRYLQLRHFFETEVKKGISAEKNEVIEELVNAAVMVSGHPHREPSPVTRS